MTNLGSAKTRSVEELLEPTLQFLIWGYAVTGDMNEFQAVVAEDHPTALANVHRNFCPPWDRDKAYTDSMLFTIDNIPQATEKFALSGLSHPEARRG